ncbi:hypothetical protein NCC49_001612 [Naganishia albida]|nr:hypothetical protein NCC49_001612 [Naganishia albida]
MSKEALLPTNMPTSKAETKSVLPKGKLLVGLFLITSANFLAWTNPHLSSYYISNIHQKVSSWRSLPTFLGDVSLHPSLLSTVTSEAEASGPPAQYPWTPSGREEPLAAEPGIDTPDTFDPTPYLIHGGSSIPLRKVTGEPGMDLERLDDSRHRSVFDVAEEGAGEQALLDWLRIAEVLNVDFTDTENDNSSLLDLDEIANLLKESAHTEGQARAVTGETLSSQVIQRLEREAIQDKKGE